MDRSFEGRGAADDLGQPFLVLADVGKVVDVDAAIAEDLDGGVDGDNDDMVLCLYDKVQRVKNKWKCVLKDGVASIDGRDYLFAKCNGEFEW